MNGPRIVPILAAIWLPFVMPERARRGWQRLRVALGLVHEPCGRLHADDVLVGIEQQGTIGGHWVSLIAPTSLGELLEWAAQGVYKAAGVSNCVRLVLQDWACGTCGKSIRNDDGHWEVGPDRYCVDHHPPRQPRQPLELDLEGVGGGWRG